MDVAARSYLTTGVAVVGATAIALAPLQVAPPDLYIRGDRTASQMGDVSLSALNDVIAALDAAWHPVAIGTDAAVSGSQAAVNRLGDALQATLVNGLSQGNTAFQSLVNGLLDEGGALAAAIDNMIAAAPSPSAFITALVNGFAQINANLAGALQIALRAALNVNVGLDATAIAHALQIAVATLAAQFNATVAGFPFVNALMSAFNQISVNVGAQLNLALRAVVNMGAGLDTAAIVHALENAGANLAAAVNSVVASFPRPEQFAAALSSAPAPTLAGLNMATDIGQKLMTNPATTLTDGFNAGAGVLLATLARFPSPEFVAAGLAKAVADLQMSLQAGLSVLPSAADAAAASQILGASINRAVGDIAGIGMSAVAEFSDAFRNTTVTALNNGADVVQAITTGLVAALARGARTEFPAGSVSASLATTVQASVVNPAMVHGVVTDEAASTKVVTLPLAAPAPTLVASPAKTPATVGQGLASVSSHQGAIATSEKQMQRAVKDVGKKVQTLGDNAGKQIGSAGDNAGKQVGSAAAGVQKSVSNAVKASTPRPPKQSATKTTKSAD